LCVVAHYQLTKNEETILNIAAFYQQHQRELICYTTRITACRDTAEDIIQESFIILSHEVKQQHIENPRAYLFCVAKNLAFDHLKRKKVTDSYTQTQSAILESTIEATSIEQIMADGENIELMKQVINELPPRCRDTFILNKLHEMSYSEVAQYVGISESGVEKHIMKGLRHCRDRLKNLKDN
jgi:RNA polymerase sigma-70 factor (ECF subfamily)